MVGNVVHHWGLAVVIPLLGVKTRCAEKSSAEHFEIHTYMACSLFVHSIYVSIMGRSFSDHHLLGVVGC